MAPCARAPPLDPPLRGAPIVKECVPSIGEGYTLHGSGSATERCTYKGTPSTGKVYLYSGWMGNGSLTLSVYTWHLNQWTLNEKIHKLNCSFLKFLIICCFRFAKISIVRAESSFQVLSFAFKSITSQSPHITCENLTDIFVLFTH